MKKSRSQADRLRRSIIDKKYKTYYKEARCFYCGDPAETIDHAPAISQVYAWGEDRYRNRGIGLWRVSCCHECNNLLGDRSVSSLQKRAEYVYRELMKRYEKHINQQNWYKEDLDEMGGILKDYIENSELVNKWIDRRLSYMEDIHQI